MYHMLLVAQFWVLLDLFSDRGLHWSRDRSFRAMVGSCFVAVASGLGLSWVVVVGLTGLLGYLLWVLLVVGGFLLLLLLLNFC